jgi:hypothetical protein
MQKALDQMNVQHLSGNWRDEHLLNLKSALDMFDALEKTIADYDARLLKEVIALQSADRQDQPVPEHPNKAKEKDIKNGGHVELSTALWRFSGADLMRIDGLRSVGFKVGRARDVRSACGARQSHGAGAELR